MGEPGRRGEVGEVIPRPARKERAARRLRLDQRCACRGSRGPRLVPTNPSGAGAAHTLRLEGALHGPRGIGSRTGPSG